VLATSACAFVPDAAETPGCISRCGTENLDEVQRTRRQTGWPEALSKSWREAVESAFPEAMVTVQESLVAACANHERTGTFWPPPSGARGIDRDQQPEAFAPEALKLGTCARASGGLPHHAVFAECRVVSRVGRDCAQAEADPEEHLALLARACVVRRAPGRTVGGSTDAGHSAGCGQAGRTMKTVRPCDMVRWLDISAIAGQCADGAATTTLHCRAWECQCSA